MVVTDGVPDRGHVAVAPAPPHGDAGVAQVGDVVVGDLVVAAVPDEHAHGVRPDVPAVADDVVVDADVAGEVRRLRNLGRLADAHAAGAQVVEEAAPDGAVAAAVAEPDGVGAGALDGALLQRDAPGVVRHDSGGDVAGSLRAPLTLGWHAVVRILECQSAQRDVCRGRAGRAAEVDQGLGHGGNDSGSRHLLARPGLVEKGAVAVEEPFARRVQGFAVVLQEVSLGLGVAEEPGRVGAGEMEQAPAGLYAGHAVAGCLPRVVGDHHHVAQPLGRQRQEGRYVSPAGQEGAVVQRPGLAGGRVGAGGDGAVHVVVALVRGPGAHGAAPVHVELLEGPSTLAHVGNGGFPQAVLGRLESGDGPAAADDRCLSRIRRVGDRAALAARVLGREGDRLGDGIGAPAEQHEDVSARLGLAQLSHGLLRAGQRGERLRRGAGVPVTAGRRNHEVGPGRRRRGVARKGGAQQNGDEPDEAACMHGVLPLLPLAPLRSAALGGARVRRRRSAGCRLLHYVPRRWAGRG